MIKKFIVFVSITLVTLFSSVGAQANNIGDVIGHTLYTDIVVTIDGYDIAGFNMDGYTYIVAEDLRNLGFTVVWSESTRELNITKAIDSTMSPRYITPEIPNEYLGQPCHSVLYTDIVAYINGTLVQSYNIGGYTIIPFNELSCFGTVSYNDKARRLTLDLYGSEKTDTYDKVLAGDLSDYSGVYENAHGYRLDLRYDGTEGVQYDEYERAYFKGTADTFEKHDDGSYTWGIGFEYDGYAMWLYPVGVEVYTYNNVLIPTDTSVVRLYAGHDYASDNEMPLYIYYPVN